MLLSPAPSNADVEHVGKLPEKRGEEKKRRRKMILAHLPPIFATSHPKFHGYVNEPPKGMHSYTFNTSFSFTPSFRCYCIKNENPNKNSFKEGFSVLGSDIPWGSGSIWSTMAFYFFSLHIPFSFGGLPVVSQVLHQPVMDLQTKALSILTLQSLELIGALLLLNYTATPGYKFAILKGGQLSTRRNWLLASAISFGFLVLLVFLTSLVADLLIGPKAVNNPVLKEILLSSNVSETACILVYCIVTPLLEETIYRGFLLTSLASTMKWQQAVIISSAIFSLAHFSGENSLQLFIIGCVLGCSYCWTGNLSSSIVVHSLYNALTLTVTLLS